jgi:L-ascorbate metabolism protein UlaG (beta-lactamase superfamily)
VTSAPPQKHFDGQRFFNPTRADGQPFWRVPQLLMTRRTPWPDLVAVRPQAPPPLQEGDAAVVTFVGHSTFLIQTRAANVLTDPIYSDRASPVAFTGPRRVRRPGVPFADLPEISVVLLSHNHYDHCDLQTLRDLDRLFNPLVVTPLKNGDLLKSAGIRRIEELDWWDESAAAPLPIAMTPAQHFSARHAFDRNRALWGSFLILAEGSRRIYFAGDSGYAPHFKEVSERTGGIHLALLPIGAYEPRWFMKDMHMTPAEAVQAHLDLAAEQSVAMHFGTFQLTPEGIDDPPIALGEALRARNVPVAQFRTLEVGESIRIG